MGFNFYGLFLPPDIFAGINFYNNYPLSYRREVTFQSVLPVFDTATGFIEFKNYRYAEYCRFIFYKKNGYLCSADTTTKFLHLWLETWDTVYLSNYFHWITDQPLYIYRYAHTLLTYAEAKARSNDLDASAYEAVNRIRRRANKANIYSQSVYDLKPGLSVAQFADSVVRERALELCGEPEGRWFDLVRLEMVEQLPELRGEDKIGPPYIFTKDHYFLPVPLQ